MATRKSNLTPQQLAERERKIAAARAAGFLIVEDVTRIGVRIDDTTYTQPHDAVARLYPVIDNAIERKRQEREQEQLMEEITGLTKEQRDFMQAASEERVPFNPEDLPSFKKESEMNTVQNTQAAPEATTAQEAPAASPMEAAPAPLLSAEEKKKISDKISEILKEDEPSVWLDIIATVALGSVAAFAYGYLTVATGFVLGICALAYVIATVCVFGPVVRLAKKAWGWVKGIFSSKEPATA